MGRSKPKCEAEKETRSKRKRNQDVEEEAEREKELNEGEADNEEEVSNDEDADVEVKGKELKIKNNNKTLKINTTESEEEEYDVECIIDHRKIDGVIEYRVRWKGFSSSQDTWENEENLDCGEVLEEYWKNKEGLDENEGGKKSSKQNKKKVKNGKKTSAKRSKTEVEPDENGEYEISRIIDMHVAKNGKHEYLVHWKGFSSSERSWEPEDHVKDTAAFERFMRRLENVKSASLKELRLARTPTDRYTLSPHAAGRRLSKRFSNKQRITYFDAD